MGSWRIARIAGIDIKIHFTFLLVVLLGAMQWGGLGARGALFGALLTLLVFASVTLHELGHSLVAKAFGIPVRDITLLPIGGVAMMTKKPKTPVQEFLIALAGPAVNVVIALVVGLVAGQVYGREQLLAAVMNARVEQPTDVTLWAMLISSNIVLAVFNLIPALPMDGGRVLRAFLAYFSNQETATRVSAIVARVIAVGLFIVGFFWNPMLSIIALFVFFGAGQELNEVKVTRVLEGIRARDAVNPYAPRFLPSTTLGEAMQALVYTPYHAFAVEHFGRLLGVITREEIIRAAQAPGGVLGYVAGAMNRQVPTISANEALESARLKMNELLSPYVAVVDGDIFLGLITEVELAQQAQLAERMKPPGTRIVFGRRPTTHP